MLWWSGYLWNRCAVGFGGCLRELVLVIYCSVGYGIVDIHGSRAQIAIDVLRDRILSVSVRPSWVGQKLKDIPLLERLFMLGCRVFYILAASVNTMVILEAVNGPYLSA